jgi:hypothetical protein
LTNVRANLSGAGASAELARRLQEKIDKERIDEAFV